MTVRGPVDAALLGPTSMHEHLFVDAATAWFRPDPLDEQGLAFRPMEPRMGGIARWNTFAIRDNLLLSPDDYEVITAEVAGFKEGGGSCLVDVTNVGMQPEPRLLHRVSTELDLHIVAGCGFYVADAHPGWLRGMRTGQIEDYLRNEVENGLSGTTIRPGVIGELGTSEQLDDVERRILVAAARVADTTGLAVNIHTHPPEQAVTMDILRTLSGAGLDLRRVYLSHLDEIEDIRYLSAVLETGATLGFDSFGQDIYFTATWKAKNDMERLQMLARLIDAGYENQLVVGQDVCMKCMLKRFGGMGYDHVIRRVMPRLRDSHGVPEAVIDKLLVGNPRRLLTIDAP